jgi:uncharacterized OsmC-like protein
VEKDDGVLVIRRIHVAYHLRADPAHKDAVERVHDLHVDKCPVYRSISGCIDITTEVRMEP